MRRLPFLALLAVLAGSFAFHAYRAEHPTSRYQSADERAYGRLAVGIADKHTYGNGLQDALHWPPGGPMLFAAGHALFPDQASAEDVRHPRRLLAAGDRLGSGPLLAAFTIACAAGGSVGGGGRGGARRLLPAADPGHRRAADRAVRRVLADDRVRAVRGRGAARAGVDLRGRRARAGRAPC